MGFMFGIGDGRLTPIAKVNQIAKKHGAWYVCIYAPGCGCGYGCDRGCPAKEYHWFDSPDDDYRFTRAEAVKRELREAGIRQNYRGKGELLSDLDASADAKKNATKDRHAENAMRRVRT